MHALTLRWPIAHAVVDSQITFWALHWNRGSPVWTDQGEYIENTVWEQIDNGVPWTLTRKIFIVIPAGM